MVVLRGIMFRLFVVLLTWVGLSIAGGMLLGGAEKKGAYFLVYPILWIIGLIMWVSFGLADQMHLNDRAAEERRR